jgi:tRNA-splicing ligase RtcB
MYELIETQGAPDVECRKDTGVIDETPMAYKPVDAVMAAQADLVEVEHTLRQVVNVKG